MAKRNRDRDDGRKASGGIRRAETIRRVESRLAQRSPGLHSEALDLDLSAFQVESPWDTHNPREQVARAQESRRPRATTIWRSNKLADQLASKRGAQRRAERISERKPTAKRVLADARMQNRVVTGKAPVNPEHLQADQPSRNSRKETVRGTCKERPHKTKGSGRGRKFVPWCDRKR